MTILYEDNHLIAVNKACGELVQGDKTGDPSLIDSLKAYIRDKCHKPGEVFLGLPHRIDRPTSGVVLFARTGKALSRLCEVFKGHTDIQKVYWAVTAQCPSEPEGTLRHLLVRNEKMNKSFVVSPGARLPEHQKAQEAVLHYRVIAHSQRYHLLEVRLETGRHHQIRCQLAAIGCPIKGDLKYGAKRSNPDGGISLHARSITLLHPVRKETMTITAPAPDEFVTLFGTVG
ncbi:MAG: RluA family pseudouridine synthase [Paludibacteraceae bacterium]|nr:RluA family pseudouridine synthase [Paludibacteraceae bacterium]